MNRSPLRTPLAAFAAGLLGAGIAAAAPQTPAAKPAPSAAVSADAWSARGTLLESCTCAVPCTCNFGEGPSPHPYCHAVFAYRLESANVGGVGLSGLVVGGADGPDGGIGLLDSRATPAQRPALERLGRLIFAQGGPASGPRKFVLAAIEHSVRGNDLRLRLGDYGGFSAAVIVGRDGRSPVVVENNTVWPVPRAIKAKASELRFAAPGVGEVTGAGVNANYGAFSFAGKLTAVQTTKTAAPGVKPGAACCAGRR